jgi:hypothetical protein
VQQQIKVYIYRTFRRYYLALTIKSLLLILILQSPLLVCVCNTLKSGTMRYLLLSALVATFSAVAQGAGSAVKGTGSTTRGWSCCKNSCSWSGKALVDKPVLTCDAQDNFLDNPSRRDGCESGGGSFACSDLSPWALSADLSY